MSCEHCPHCREESRRLVGGQSGASIAQMVALHYHVDLKRLKAPERGQQIVMPRFIAMYLMREMTSLSYPSIGAFFHRHHASVMHGCALIRRRIAAGNGFAREVAKVRALIESAGKQEEQEAA